jgi:hypothetical protein
MGAATAARPKANREGDCLELTRTMEGECLPDVSSKNQGKLRHYSTVTDRFLLLPQNRRGLRA